MPERKEQQKYLGRHIRELRNQCKLSQEKVVAKLQLQGFDICRSTYVKIENGEREPTPEEWEMLAAVFGVSQEELMNF